MFRVFIYQDLIEKHRIYINSPQNNDLELFIDLNNLCTDFRDMKHLKILEGIT